MSTELTVSKPIPVANKAQAIERLRTSLESIVTIRERWVEGKKEELQKAIEAHAALAAVKASATKLRYSRNRVQMLRKVVNCLEAGFVPIPRFTANKVNIDFEDLPLNALLAFNDANATGLFDEVKIVSGDKPDAPRKGRDPLLVGIVRMPGAILRRYNDFGTQIAWRYLPSRVEHFLVAWWRPEDEVDQNMF